MVLVFGYDAALQNRVWFVYTMSRRSWINSHWSACSNKWRRSIVRAGKRGLSRRAWRDRLRVVGGPDKGRFEFPTRMSEDGIVTRLVWPFTNTLPRFSPETGYFIVSNYNRSQLSSLNELGVRVDSMCPDSHGSLSRSVDDVGVTSHIERGRSVHVVVTVVGMTGSLLRLYGLAWKRAVLIMRHGWCRRRGVLPSGVQDWSWSCLNRSLLAAAGFGGFDVLSSVSVVLLFSFGRRQSVLISDVWWSGRLKEYWYSFALLCLVGRLYAYILYQAFAFVSSWMFKWSLRTMDFFFFYYLFK